MPQEILDQDLSKTIKAFSPADQQQYDELTTELLNVSNAQEEVVLNSRIQAYIDTIRAQYLTNSSLLSTEDKNQVIDALDRLSSLQLEAYTRVNNSGSQAA